uniref:Uncharacterized protein n=1 Tax=Cacopsylla melanoneura TaxID=428564 RepID=A0A8D9FBE6_9HEMI
MTEFCFIVGLSYCLGLLFQYAASEWLGFSKQKRSRGNFLSLGFLAYCVFGLQTSSMCVSLLFMELLDYCAFGLTLPCFVSLIFIMGLLEYLLCFRFTSAMFVLHICL